MICTVCHSAQKRIFNYRGYEYERCAVCGLVSTWPIPDLPTIEDHYKHKAVTGNYELLRNYSDQYRSVYERFADIIERNSKLTQRNNRLLDIGCFRGDFLGVMADRGWDVFGAELQTDAAAAAMQRFPGRIYQGDVTTMQLPVKTFDVVSMTGLIEHVVDPVGLMNSVSQRVRDDGLVFLQTPNSASLLARMMGRYWPPYSPVEHIHLFSVRSLTLLLRKVGLSVFVVSPHWKNLPIAYVFRMLENFSPELQRVAAPIFNCIPRSATARPLPFYVGEMIVLARKNSSSTASK
jgi:2-polyprenyl-3-methyl-5-hydroxy-6-metoxy-1,4-benzoquinol methylase